KDGGRRFHVTFPSLNLSERPSEDNGNEQNQCISEEKEPVVILLGWVGCKDKYLAKYSAFYEKRGSITIRYTAPTEKVFFGSGKMQPIAEKLLELLYDLSLDKNPIFFHVFSNGGGILYQSMIDILLKEHKSLNICGTIFDSCPAPKKISTAFKAFKGSMIGMNPVISWLFGMIVYSWLVMTVLLRFVISKTGLKSDVDAHSFHARFRNCQSRWPSLFLYSTADDITESSYVDEVIAHRKSLRVQVSSICWEDSGHVSHMRTHPEVYVKQCYDFIDRCLKH
ncbi:unnamed protein product, partial [Owenia fusiformis]